MPRCRVAGFLDNGRPVARRRMSGRLCATMEIRDLTREDYDELVSLWERGGLPYRPNGRDARERIARELKGDSAIFLAAESGGRLVGAVLGTHDGRKGWINRLVVAPERRREGIAAALVEAVTERLAARGIGIVTCLIEDWNATSAAFFESIGFVRHEDITYYSRRDDDGI